jgi:predicted house-cleaning noncanonical NTP pyrophosphatase (MazG superfamily)
MAKRNVEERYNKLVRDRVPTIIREGGAQVRARPAHPEERRPLLRAKLQEELREFLDARNSDERLEELVDLLDVLEAVRKDEHITRAELELARRRKHHDKGGFSRFLILQAVSSTYRAPKLRLLRALPPLKSPQIPTVPSRPKRSAKGKKV